ncbi:MAG: hypothetical protein MZW92_18825 [Comamonadaceae bacterium]|nr:hypothetical protein [Comamonadaceae bacterium]
MIEERNRYFANRIAQTEIARAHADRVADEFLADPTIEVVEVRMSPSHPVTDICDLFARQDRFGLGPGLYSEARRAEADLPSTLPLSSAWSAGRTCRRGWRASARRLTGRARVPCRRRRRHA